MSTELVIIEKLKLDLVPFFTKEDRLDELLSAIAVEVMAHVPDVSTPTGQTLITTSMTAGTKYRLHPEESGNGVILRGGQARIVALYHPGRCLNQRVLVAVWRLRARRQAVNLRLVPHPLFGPTLGA